MKVVTANKMQEMDARAMEEYKIPGVVLMENAGLRVVEEIVQDYSTENLQVIIVSGKGNNGGDGFVIARHLINMGVAVTVYAMSEEKDYRGDALINYCILKHMKVGVKHILKEEDLQTLEGHLAHADLIIDALLGTGLSSNVRGLIGEVIDMLNACPRQVLAVDIPSGIHADTGEVLGRAVEAVKTVTFALPKQGLYLYPGAQNAGEVVVGDISMPREIMEDREIMVYLTSLGLVRECLPERPACSHKGTYGRVFIAGGSPGLTGAVAMAGEAALRSGSGLITAGVPAGLNHIMEVKLTEVMSLSLPDTGENHLSKEALNPVLQELKICDAAGFGPGVFPGEEGTLDLLGEIIKNTPVPLVIDAGGLTLLAEKMEVLGEAPRPLVLTPHPGEMARMLNISPEEVEKDRLNLAQTFAKENKVVLVLKGARTLTALPSGEVHINTTGNPGMASGGTGDVLTGLVVGLVGQGLTPEEGAVCGVYIHGLAGDLAARAKGEAGLTAMDLIEHLPGAMQTLYDAKRDKELEVKTDES